MITSLPSILVHRLNNDWESFSLSLEQHNLEFSPGQELRSTMMQVWACSPFLSRYCIESPQDFLALLSSGDLNRDFRPQDYRSGLRQRLVSARDEASLMQLLRQYRQQQIFRIAWRDLAGWASLNETLRDLSLLADACVDLALGKLFTWACKQWGTPRHASGASMKLVVLGMGKLGAYELNFSSDIDLMFAYAEEGQTRKRRGLTHEEFFTRLGQQLINVIDQSTMDGFVFRVDMRLRPYGDSGGLAISFDAMEEYYQYQGREWERYAMIKARVIAGDFVAGKQLLENLRPFTYRRYLDYSAFESLRTMKGMIARQVQRKGMEQNIKLGQGGIREIEFIGQAFQLIRGGREPELQVRGIVPVLNRLAEKNYIPQYVCDQLLAAYRFLRLTENHIQAYADQQAHSLPDDEQEQASLALSLGYVEWDEFVAQLNRHRQIVQEAFEQVMAAPQAGAQGNGTEQLSSVWMGLLEEQSAHALLEGMGYQDPFYVLNLLTGLRESVAYRSRSNVGQERMDRIMPLVLGAVAKVREPDICLLRVINLLETIAGRSTYLALLVENPMALSQLVRLFSASGWIAEHLTHYPVLLDELLDARSLYSPLKKAALEQELASQLSYIDDDDLEQQMETMRVFKQSHVLHVAAADLTEAIPLMVVSDYLTAIAEVILQQVLQIARQNLISKHGHPVCKQGKKQMEAGFVVIGYGKLGGIELGYGSDLDMVFLHNSQAERRTDGGKALDHNVFFARLGQRMIHILNTPTTAGTLYEVDMRLRPSGASGLLVSDLDTFRRYQQEEAWTWEHQALVRARPIVGDSELIDAFIQVRREILCQQREPASLQQEVCEMRERMRSELGSKRSDRFHLKQDEGGIADIEFIVQYLILRWAHEFPELVEFTDNIRQLDCLANNKILTRKQADTLAEAYKAYRARGHYQVLTDEPGYVGAGEFASERKQIKALWKKIMLDKPV